MYYYLKGTKTKWKTFRWCPSSMQTSLDKRVCLGAFDWDISTAPKARTWLYRTFFSIIYGFVDYVTINLNWVFMLFWPLFPNIRQARMMRAASRIWRCTRWKVFIVNNNKYCCLSRFWINGFLFDSMRQKYIYNIMISII